MTFAVGVDIGGTKIKCGLVNLQAGKAVETITFRTPTNKKKLFTKIAKAVTTLAAQKRIAGVGIGTAGIFKGKLVSAGALPFNNTNVEQEAKNALESKGLKVEVRAVNDAIAAGLGELHYGGHDEKTLLLLTLGTGIGGSFVDNSPRLKEPYVRGMEPGQILLHPDEPELEAQIGTRAMVRFYKGKQKIEDSEDLAKLQEQGDKHAIRAMNAVASKLAHALQIITQTHTPEAIVLAGGMRKWEALVEKTREEYLRLRSPVPHAKIRITAHENLGVLGAASLFKK
ncbi:MAG: ROK family protein [Candidatus Norongarragalinales archaeon]